MARSKVTPRTASSTATSLREELERWIAAVPGVERQVSRYGHGPSFALGGRELVHFHGESRMDVRLTREEIRQRKLDEALDPRLITRGPGSEWVEIRVLCPEDLAFALSIVEGAVRANQ